MRKHVLASALVFGLASAAHAGIGPNLLNNPGFEDPLGFDFSNPSNWNGFFGGPAGTFLQAFNDTGTTPRSGVNALVTTIRGDLDDSLPPFDGVLTDGFGAFTGHVQVVTGIVPGQLYEMAIWARTNPAITNGAEYRVEWQDAGGVEIARRNVEIQSLLSSSYQQFSFTEAAPAGAARAVIVLAVQSFINDGVIANTSVAWDDASFSVVPAPGAGVVALGAAGLFAARRRRR